MILERVVCDLVSQHWNDLHSEGQAPDSLIFLKVAGKTSPNANIVAMILDARSQQAVAVAKIPRNPQSTQGLRREYSAMVNLRSSISNLRILDHTPYRGVLIEIEGLVILLQSAGTGYPMVRKMSSPKSVIELYKMILPWMFEFHAHGAEPCALEGDTLHQLIKAPIDRFMEQFKDISTNILSKQTRIYLHELPKSVAGRTIRLCRQHGDFNAHNTLVEYDGDHLINFTLIDWEDYREQRLPIHDLNHFFTSNSHLLATGMSPVESFSKLLLSDGWYRDLYKNAINDFENMGLIDRETFRFISPLYMIEMCFQMTDVQREQQDTIHIWMKRMDLLINKNFGSTH